MYLPGSQGAELMKAGDLIKLPQDQGYTIAVKVITHEKDPKMPIGDKAVMVIQDWGPDWWDADACEVINEVSG